MQHRQHFQTSILDRLVDQEDTSLHTPVQMSIDNIKNSIIRDLEHLLNTRRQWEDVPESYTYVDNSFYTYGIGDFSSKEQLKKEIENAINKFEKRLNHVRVTVKDNSTNGNNTHNKNLKDIGKPYIEFTISAALSFEKESEPIVFDSLFYISNGRCKVNENRTQIK